MAITEVGYGEPETLEPALKLVEAPRRQARVSTGDVMADQMRLPQGLLAPLAARSLNRRNFQLIGQTIAALDIGPGHRVLDVGFGGGISLEMLMANVGHALVAGIEPSPEMVTRACRLYAEPIREGRLVVGTGSAEAIPFGDASFERALTCQTVYFWADIDKGLQELHRVLVPGGRLAVAMMPKGLQQRFGFARRGYSVISHHELMAALQDAGFAPVRPWPPNAPDPRWIVLANRP